MASMPNGSERDLVTCALFNGRRWRLHVLENELEAGDAGVSRRGSYLSCLPTGGNYMEREEDKQGER
jgi:hypothetical protein